MHREMIREFGLRLHYNNHCPNWITSYDGTGNRSKVKTNGHIRVMWPLSGIGAQQVVQRAES